MIKNKRTKTFLALLGIVALPAAMLVGSTLLSEEKDSSTESVTLQRTEVLSAGRNNGGNNGGNNNRPGQGGNQGGNNNNNIYTDDPTDGGYQRWLKEQQDLHSQDTSHNDYLYAEVDPMSGLNSTGIYTISCDYSTNPGGSSLTTYCPFTLDIPTYSGQDLYDMANAGTLGDYGEGVGTYTWTTESVESSSENGTCTSIVKYSFYFTYTAETSNNLTKLVYEGEFEVSGHSESIDYKYDNDGHYTYCLSCETKIGDTIAHTKEYRSVETAASKDAAATLTIGCTDCEWTKTVKTAVINEIKSGEDGYTINTTPSNCTTEGSAKYYYTYEEDGVYEENILIYEETLETSDHSYGNEYSYDDAEGHYTTCTVCGAKNPEVAAHTKQILEGDVTVAESFDDKATIKITCEFCKWYEEVTTKTISEISPEDTEYAVSITGITCTDNGTITYTYDYTDGNFTKEGIVIYQDSVETEGHKLDVDYSEDKHFKVCEICDDTFEEDSHSKQLVSGEDTYLPTENAEGNLRITCTEECGWSKNITLYSGDALEALSDDELAEEGYTREVISELDCVTDRVVEYYYENEDEAVEKMLIYTATIEAKGHSLNYEVAEDGHVLACECGFETSAEAHQKQFNLEYDEETGGTFTATCEKCTWSYKDENVLPIKNITDGENYKVEVTAEPTCEEKGTTSYYYLYEEEEFLLGETPIEALDHDLGDYVNAGDEGHNKKCGRDDCEHQTEPEAHTKVVSDETVYPDAEKDGTLVLVCEEDCGWRSETTLPATGSETEEEGTYQTTVVDPTCEDDGSITYTYQYDETSEPIVVNVETIDSLGHDYEYVAIEEAPELGHTVSCTRCDIEEYTEDHDFSGDTITSEEGLEGVTCVDCGYTQYKEEELALQIGGTTGGDNDPIDNSLGTENPYDTVGGVTTTDTALTIVGGVALLSGIYGGTALVCLVAGYKATKSAEKEISGR